MCGDGLSVSEPKRLTVVDLRSFSVVNISPVRRTCLSRTPGNDYPHSKGKALLASLVVTVTSTLCFPACVILGVLDLLIDRADCRVFNHSNRRAWDCLLFLSSSSLWLATVLLFILCVLAQWLLS